MGLKGVGVMASKSQKYYVDKVNKMLCPINPIYQALEYFYNMRKRN